MTEERQVRVFAAGAACVLLLLLVWAGFGVGVPELILWAVVGFPAVWALVRPARFVPILARLRR